MKKIHLQIVIAFLVIFSQFTFAQDTVTIILRGEYVEDAYINLVNNSPNPKSQTLIESKWTYFGFVGTGRSLVKFDLSEIPHFSKIVNSTLSLYHDPTSNHIGHSDLGGDNTGAIIRIIEDWEDESVIWDNQPRTTNTNRKMIHPPDTDDDDYPNLNVTRMIQDMVNHPETGKGMMLKLYDENTLYRSLVFASNDHQDTALRPALLVSYSSEVFFDTIIKLQPNAEKGKDVYINSVYSGPDGEKHSLIAAVWEYWQGFGVGRALLDFDMSSIGYTLDVQKAELHLYKNPSSGHQGHSKIGGENSSYIRRIVEPWDEYTVDWYKQPSTTNANQVEVLNSDLSNQDFLSIDVTQLILDMIENPAEGYGLQLRLVKEDDIYRSIVFASSDHEDSTLWPRLDLYCSLVTRDKEITKPEFSFSVYPNPGSGQFTLVVENRFKEVQLNVMDAVGKTLINQNLDGKTTGFDLSVYPKGFYFVQLISDGRSYCRKLIVR